MAQSLFGQQHPDGVQRHHHIDLHIADTWASDAVAFALEGPFGRDACRPDRIGMAQN